MQKRRGRNRIQEKEFEQENTRTTSKSQKNEVNYDNKQNLMVSLVAIFQESVNQPALIYPWINQFHFLEQRIIGTTNIVVGPSQSGKYSIVKFALNEFYPNVQQILIDCRIATTENQFFRKMIAQFKQKYPECKWPQENKFITSDNIDFSLLNPLIEKFNVQFIIIVKNGEHLVGFKKQIILYNLFQWMGSKAISKRGGLVILTRNLYIVDRFQKRVKSRFMGNKICIYRPEDPEIYIKIIIKRIEAVIKTKRNFLKVFKNKTKNDSNIFEQTEEQTKPKTKIKQNSKISLENLIKKNSDCNYAKQIDQYLKSLRNYIKSDIDRQKIELNQFIFKKIYDLERSQIKTNMKLFSDETSLTIKEQIDCLLKLKQAVQKNEEMLEFFKTKINQYQILSIPLTLRIFQHIFLTIEQSIVKELSVNNLKVLLLKLLEKNVEYQFPINAIESNSLQNFNNIEMYLLMMIYKQIISKRHPIKLLAIYHQYKAELNQEICKQVQREESRIPIVTLEHAIDRLYRSQVIKYQPNNIWNSEIILLMEKQKIAKGIQYFIKHRKKIPSFLEKQIQELELNQKFDQVQAFDIKLTPSNF